MINKFVNCVKRGVKSGFHKVMDSRPVRCCVGVALGLFASTCKALADSGAGYEAGKNAISQASEQIAQYVPIATKLCYAIAGVVAIVGAISVYVKMNNEEQDVKKSIMMIIGAVGIALIILKQMKGLHTKKEFQGILIYRRDSEI